VDTWEKTREREGKERKKMKIRKARKESINKI